MTSPLTKGRLLADAMRAIASERDPETLVTISARACASALQARSAWVIAQSEHLPLSTGCFGFAPGELGPEVFGSELACETADVALRGPTPGPTLGLPASLTFASVVAARWELRGASGWLFAMDREDGLPFDELDATLASGLAAQLAGAFRSATELLIARATGSIHRTLVEQLPAVTYYRALDKPGIPAFISPQVTELTGFSQEEVLLEPDFFRDRILHPEDRAGISENQAAHQGQPVRVEYRIVRRDGSIRWVHNHALSVRDETDDARLVVGVIIDVTEQRSTREAQQATERRLEEQLRETRRLEAVSRLAGGIAHSFNNLLGVIMGYTQVAKDRSAPDDQSHGDLTQVLEAAERARSLTSKMLSFGGQKLVEPRLVDVGQLVDGMRSLLEVLLGDDIVLHVNVERGAHATFVDPNELEQLVLSLVSNARDALPNGGRVEIEVGRAPAEELTPLAVQGSAFVRLRVRDNGIGMDEPTQARAFDPFFSTKEREKGAGLGLSMAVGVAKEAGGAIAVESSPGRGSVFSVYLPEASPARRESAASVASAEPIAGSDDDAREMILIVDDEPAIRRLVSRLLSAKGYTVLEAEDGNEALRVAEQHPDFDLLLTDVIMPGPSGRELYDALVERGQDKPVLFMSGYTDDTVVRHGVREAEFTLLTKPFNAATLYEKVRLVLDQAKTSACPAATNPR